MGFPDGAEYWEDVKSRKKFTQVRHYRTLDKANALCGADVGSPDPKRVNCPECREAIWKAANPGEIDG